MSSATEPESDAHRVVSPLRPLPRSARRALATYNVVDEIDPDDDMGRGGGVVVTTRPPRDLLHEFDLSIDEAPLERWNMNGTTVEIYPDRVVNDTVGQMSISPTEAARRLRQDNATQIDTNGREDPLGVEPVD